LLLGAVSISPSAFLQAGKTKPPPPTSSGCSSFPRFAMPRSLDAQHGEGRGDWRAIPRVIAAAPGPRRSGDALFGDWHCL